MLFVRFLDGGVLRFMGEKKKYKKPLSRSVIVGCVMFIILFDIVMGFISYSLYNGQMMNQYNEHITGVMNLAIANIDVEDLKISLVTKKPTGKFNVLMNFFDQTRVSYKLESLTMVRPMKNGDRYEIMQVLSGLYPNERAGIEVKDNIPLPLLGDDITPFLPEGFPETIYNDFINRTDIKYSETNTDFGRTYDAAKTIRDKEGNPVVLLISSVSLQEIDEDMSRYMTVIIISTVGLSAIIIISMILWLRIRIIQPLQRLGMVAEDFAEKSHDSHDPNVLVIKKSNMHTGDEIEALEDTLVEMSRNMKSYVEKLIRSAIEVEGMRLEVDRANAQAMRDALTGVKNKSAYDRQRNRLDLDIRAGDAEFAIIMMDLNYLKHINDDYGHEKGDIYIKKMCTMICDTFTHSPVFRVGGDEFIIVLIHRDFENRDELVSDIKSKMTELYSQTELSEWLRPTAALGLAVYDRDKDVDSDSVLKRADELMYANKKAMKAERKD